MHVERLAFPEVLLITPERFGDERGWFSQAYVKRELEALGLRDVFLQDNQAFSAQRGTLRGLHLQVPPEPISKLIRVLKGAIYDVAVDVRASSPTYGRWVAAELSADNGRQLYCPRGFAHAYLTLTADTEVFYKIDGYYAPKCERGLRWNDPAIGIDWPVAEADLTINDRDRALPLLADFAPVVLDPAETRG
jgi:dTDP-4-dehydrorhamnose 3,5-epimerase